MLGVVDRVMELMPEEPGLFSLEDGDVPAMQEAGALMRERLEGIEAI